MNLLDVSFQLLSTAHGPVVSMKGRLHQRSHHASHRCFVPAAVALTIMLHAQTAPTGREKQKHLEKDNKDKEKAREEDWWQRWDGIETRSERLDA